MKNSPCRMLANRQSGEVWLHSRETGRSSGQSACQTGCPSRQRDSDARRRNSEIRTADKLRRRLRWIWKCFKFLWKTKHGHKFYLKWPTCICLAMFGDEKSTTTRFRGNFGGSIPVSRRSLVNRQISVLFRYIFRNPGPSMLILRV